MVLLDLEAGRPPVFRYFPAWKQVYYAGEPAEGFKEYTAEAAEGLTRLLQGEIIFRDDKELWEAWKELYGFAVKTAEQLITGTYDLELLCLGSETAMQSFQPQNLAGLLVNHAKRLANAERTVFPYASGWLLLKKLAPADWGKIRFSHNVTAFNKERAQLSLYLKKALDYAAGVPGNTWIVIRDLSRDPVWRFGEEPQTEKLGKLLAKNKELLKEKIRGIYVLHREEGADLCRQFGFGPAD